MQTPFSLRIFLADGDPDGLRIVDKSNWIGKALVFPRALLPQVKVRPELAQTGVYLLLGPRSDGEGDMLYDHGRAMLCFNFDSFLRKIHVR
ncbi:hypothetical protein [Rhodoferax sp.]|uniref:hypothetical protein n=1 Tax=Rhodoferax sp. TaxID=50421 RepID=UPI0025F0D727|nr:hypothetical protein [Rhodoferax sp.]